MKQITITGREANALLFMLDKYLNTDSRGQVEWRGGLGLSSNELQVLRDRLFAAHEHTPAL